MALRFVLLATLTAFAVGATLQVSVHQFTRRDFRGTFSRLFNLPGCPQKIYHQGANDNATAVLHGDTRIGEVVCEGNGQMNVFPITDAAKVNALVNSFTGAARNLAQSLINNARNVAGSVVGTSDVDRKCGTVTIAKNSLFVFVNSDQDFTVAPGFLIQRNQRGMVYLEAGKSAYCVYAAKPVPSPSPSVQPQTAPGTGNATGNGTAIGTGNGNGTGPNGTDPNGTAQNATDPNGTGTNVTETTPDTTPGPTTPTPGAPAPAANGTAANGTETEPAASPESDGVICFPGLATVKLENGLVKRMIDLEIGDRVQVGVNSYSDVFMFTHKLSAVSHKFVHLSTASGDSIALTKGHYLRVNGQLKPARTVTVGDQLSLANGRSSPVVRVASVENTGLFNPQTVDGAIVVDNIIASTYTTTVEMTAAHSMLSPLRLVYNFFGLSMTALESGADSIAPMLPKGGVSY